jgi:glycosyltransferase involved in cell wall biosynthesis
LGQNLYFVHYSSKPGGIEVLLPTIINGLKDHQINAFVIRPSVSSDKNVYDGLPVKVNYGSKSTFSALIKFFSFVKQDKEGIYQLYNTGPLYLLILKILNVKRVVYSIHGTIYWRTAFQKSVRKFIWKIGVSRRFIFTANSEYSARIFNESVLKNVSPTILYNPIDLKRFNFSRGKSTDTIKIIYVGRLVQGKNFSKWLKAAKYLLDKNVDVTFEIYGTGHLGSELKQEIETLGLQKKIKLKGFVKEIETVYKNADLLLFLSEYESFGNVAVESILCGTPVITFDIPSMKEIFNDHPQFLIKDDQQYCEIIFNKIKHIEELKSGAEVASQDFAKRFGSENHIDKLESIYAQLS